MPLMLHMWLGAGSGNANFFYFYLLVWNVFALLILFEFVGAAVKSDKARRDAWELAKANVEEKKKLA